MFEQFVKPRFKHIYVYSSLAEESAVGVDAGAAVGAGVGGAVVRAQPPHQPPHRGLQPTHLAVQQAA